MNYFNLIKQYSRKAIGYPFLSDVTENRLTASKKILFIYITKPFRLKTRDKQFFAHQNIKQCQQIVSLLGEKGFSVDLLDINDNRHHPKGDYDVVISHRVSNCKQDAFTSKNNIYLATGLNHNIHNSQVLSRHQYLFERKGIKIAPKNLNPVDMPYVEKADELFCFGNEFVKNTWKQISKAECLNFHNYGYDQTIYLGDDRNLDKARKSFLFFASTFQISKGLDLLLEIFAKNPDLHLYVCSLFANEREFCKIYSNELFKTKNIHPVGWVDVNSPLFYKLCADCAFVIHPSCSDASPGSVVQTMHTGLIPIVTPHSGIDVDKFGFLLSNDREDYIENVVRTVSDLSLNQLRESSYQTRLTSIEKYSEQSFINRWRELIETIT